METKEKLRRILQEWKEFDIPHGYPRDLDTRLLKGKEILSIIGARRTGKTYLCYQMARSARESLPAGNVIYINLEDERLSPTKGDELTLLWDICREMLTIDMTKRVYLFVDEIQNAANWSKWARRITDQNPNIKLIITGSSSRLLSREIATELRGRTLSVKVFPLSFREFLSTRGIKVDIDHVLYSRERPLIKKAFNEYLDIGGFPAVLDSPNRKELLKEYYSVMFYRDLAERHKVKDLRLLEDYLTLLIDQVAALFSITSTAKKLAEFGHSPGKTTLSNFLKFAEDSFLVFGVKKFSFKMREQLRAPRKIYVIDHGLVRAIRFFFSEDRGRMLENIAFLHLYRSGKDIYYHQGTRECDFLTVDAGRVTEAFQICSSVSAPQTREREIRGLVEAMEVHKLKTGYILTEDENEEISVSAGKVLVQPLWYRLLA
jgi:uncharacterized protein